jgi:rubrerythrin
VTSQPANLLPWRVEDIPFDRIDHARIRDREEMKILLIASSFVEHASDTYAGNLAEFTADQPDIAAWLAEHWEPEEMQHGRALRAYVAAVWPEFDWEAAYAAFFEDYRRLCGVEGYAPSQGLEMAARCIVETGTSTLYRAIGELADEPVLGQLVEKIRNDEVRHYKHFLQYFDRYDRIEKSGRMRVARILKARLTEAVDSDGEVGIWHAYHALHPDERRDGARFRATQGRIARMVRKHYPAVQAMKMILKPLRLSAFVTSLLQPILAPVALLLRRVVLR